MGALAVPRSPRGRVAGRSPVVTHPHLSWLHSRPRPFANGLWMCCQVVSWCSLRALNVFWRYVFHYIDYQAYVFRGMMVNEFGRRNYACEPLEGGGCHCMYRLRASRISA